MATTIPSLTPYSDPAPQRGDRTTFRDRADSKVAHDVVLVGDGTTTGEFNTTITALNTANSEVETNAANAESAATSALNATNFKGNWSDLTGAATVPFSVYHLSQFWELTENIADITTEVPGTSSKWVRSYNTVVNALGDLGGGTDDIDYRLGDYISATVSTSEQTFTFSNPPSTGINGTFVLYLTNGGSQTVNWPSSVDWAGGTAPTLTSAGVDILVFSTIDAGTIWTGSVYALDAK